MRNFSSLSTVFALALLSACASSRDVQGVVASGGTGCITCHGGTDNLTGAPPLDVDGLTSSAAVGAHTAHLDAGVACASCHANVNLGDPNFPNHRNGVVNVDFGGVAVAPNGAPAPVYTAASHTCANVYCHGNLPRNALASRAVPAWTQTSGWTACNACHDGNGVNPATDTFTRQHGAHQCSNCHGPDTDLQCQTCHAGFTRSPLAVNAATHVDGRVEINGTVSVHGQTLTIGWDPTGGSTGMGSCATSCHTLHNDFFMTPALPVPADW